MNRRIARHLGAVVLLLATVGQFAQAQAPLADSAGTSAPVSMSAGTANLRAGITLFPSAAAMRVDTAAAGITSHRRAHAATGAKIGAVAGAGAGTIAAALLVAEDRRHPERHNYQADYRPSAGYIFMAFLGLVGAGAGALAGATLGALIP